MPAAGAPTSPGAKKSWRSRLGAAGRWMCIVIGTAGLGAWIAGALVTVSYTTSWPVRGGFAYWFASGNGALMFGWSSTPPLQDLPNGVRYTAAKLDFYPPRDWWWWPWMMFPNSGGNFYRTSTPGWLLAIPLLAVVSWDLCAAILSGIKPGHCRCGYDLAGLPSAASVCPECGAARKKQAVNVQGQSAV